MTTIEFSDAIDEILRPQNLILDPYEKSLLLTFVQEQMIEDLYTNSTDSFEETEKRRRQLSNLIYSFTAYKEEADKPKFTKPYDNGSLVKYNTVCGLNSDKIENYSLVRGDGNYDGIRNNQFTNINQEDIRNGVPLLEEIPITKKTKGFQKIKSDSQVVTLPENLMFIIYEHVIFNDKQLECLDGSTAVVVPITHDEYYKAMQNPFRRPNDKRVFRLDVAHPSNEFEANGRLLYLYNRYHKLKQEDIEYLEGYSEILGPSDRFNLRDDDRPQLVELISKYKINQYFCRYIKRPNPIIVEDLPDYLTIHGLNRRSESEVNPILHKAILENAIKLAISHRNG